MSPPPLKRWLDSPTDEARIVRMWSEVRRRRQGPRRGRWIALAAAGTVAAAAAVAGLVVAARDDPDALPMADGALPGTIETDAQSRRTVAMADGSTLELAPGSRLETIENAEGRFATLLARGTVRVSVVPGGPRRWVVESGLATVEVIGTVFTVDRSRRGVRVSVERGVVLVRGERVPDRVARLSRGQALFVPRAPPTEVAARAPAPATDRAARPGEPRSGEAAPDEA
ncbi:MAG TPA: FecR family protein, partial [Sandaracinaceae bacterium LLY-WYZ-13_1]|nr:FecR family protein [Sandaracinaceae bacterium LLY-WYZ-13_1]